MKPPNQTMLRGFIFRRLQPITRAIALTQCLAVVLAAPAVTAQSRPVATTNVSLLSTEATPMNASAEPQTLRVVVLPFQNAIDEAARDDFPAASGVGPDTKRFTPTRGRKFWRCEPPRDFLSAV